MNHRWSSDEVVQAGYVSLVLQRFMRAGLLLAMRKPISVKSIAATLACSAVAAKAQLDFLILTTDLLAVREGQYSLKRKAWGPGALEFHLNRMESLGGNSSVSESKIESLFDEYQYSMAFSGLELNAAQFPNVQVLSALRPNALLDLGCGSGHVLIELAKSNPDMSGWGIDVNAHACKSAQVAARFHGLSRRLRFSLGDISCPSSWAQKLGQRPDVIHASGVLNQFWNLPAVVDEIRTSFPGSVLVVQEYLGKLGAKSVDLTRFRLTVTHDLFQTLTNQPIPPRTASMWKKIFSEAGCSILKTYQGEASGVRWVLFVVLL